MLSFTAKTAYFTKLSMSNLVDFVMKKGPQDLDNCAQYGSELSLAPENSICQRDIKVQEVLLRSLRR